MIKYVIQCETGLQGSSYYNTKSEAGHAARWREFAQAQSGLYQK